MLIKKIVISPDNTKAVKFFAELERRKAILHEKLEKRFSFPVRDRIAPITDKMTTGTVLSANDLNKSPQSDLLVD